MHIEPKVLPQLTEEAKEEFKKGSKDNPLKEENMQLKQRLAKLENDKTTKHSIYVDPAEMGADFGR